MRIVNWVSCVFAGGLAGCSLYPIPDDVSPFRTEEIVRYGRCEVRNAILAHMVNVGIITTQSTVEEIRSQIEAATKKAKAKKAAKKSGAKKRAAKKAAKKSARKRMPKKKSKKAKKSKR